ncbi:MAG: hypothetical protein R3C59_18630 [Planctomycetaceae bacterium]
MSTVAKSSSAYADCDEYIEYQIQVARHRIRWTDLLTAALLAAVLLLGYVLVFTILDHWVIVGGFTPWTRAIMLSVVGLISGGILWQYVIRPWSRRIHPLYAARMLDAADADMDGALLSLIDLNSSGTRPAPEAVRRVMEKRAALRLAEVNMDEAIDRRWLMNLGFLLFGLVLATCLYAVFSPKAINLLRPLSLTNSAVATRTRILKVQPGHATIAAGEQLPIQVDIGGQIPEEVQVVFTTVDNTYVDQPSTMQPTENEGRFQTLMTGEGERGLRQSFSYHVVAGDASSETFQVIVNQPPSANVTHVAYDYPDYMRLPDHQSQNGNLVVWEGTQVTLTAEANVPLQTAVLKFSDTASFETPAEEVPLTVDGTSVTGQVTLELREDQTSPKFYRIEVADQEGHTDPQPTVYAVNVRPDRAPVVKLIDPIRDLRVPANAIQPLLIQAEDPDFLLRSVKLHYDVNGESRTPELLFDATRSGPQKTWLGTWEFDLGNLELKEGDVVNYYITARDNRPPLGSQSRTAALKLMVEQAISPEKVQERLQQDKQLQQQELRHEAQDPARENAPESEGEGPDPADKETAQSGPSDDKQRSDSGKSETGKDESQVSGKQSDSPEHGSKDGHAQSSQTSNATDGSPEDSTSPGKESSEADGTAKSGSSGSKSDDQSDQSGGIQSANDKSHPAKDESPNEGSQSNDSERPGPPTDDEVIQKLLDRYEDKLEEPSGNNMENESGTKDAATDSQPDNASNAVMDPNAPAKSSPESAAGPSEPDPTQPKNEDSSSQSVSDSATDPGRSNSSAKDDASKSKDSDAEKMPTGGDSEQSGGDEEKSETATESTTQEMSDSNQTASNEGDQKDTASPEQDGAENANSTVEDAQKKNSQENQQDGQQGQQAGQQGQQAGQGGQQGQQAGQQGQQGGQQGQQAGQQGQQAGQQGQQGRQQGQQAGQQGQQGRQQGQQGRQQGQQAGQQGQQAGQQGQQGRPASRTASRTNRAGKVPARAVVNRDLVQIDRGRTDNKAQHSRTAGAVRWFGIGPASRTTGPASRTTKPQQAGQQGQQAGQQGQQGGQGSGKGGGQPGPGGNRQGQNGQPAQNSGSGGSGSAPPVADQPNVEAAAKAADMVLKRLQKDLDRGQVDQGLLDELGWTEQELKDFQQRMQQQLEAMKKAPADPSADQLQRQRVEELLKSLDVQSGSGDRIGRRDRDVEQQDTTSRKSNPPSQYKDWLELYQRSLSKGHPQSGP